MSGKTILITGATAGIGRSTALSLASQGCRVFATGRNEKLLAELAKESGGKIETVRLDVNDLNSIRSAADQVHTKTQGYGVDVLINNAGYGQFGPLLAKLLGYPPGQRLVVRQPHDETPLAAHQPRHARAP